MVFLLAALLTVMPVDTDWRSPLAPHADIRGNAPTRLFDISQGDDGWSPELTCELVSLTIFAATKGREGASCPATPARQDFPHPLDRTAR
jgi:hypothetical protein